MAMFDPAKFYNWSVKIWLGPKLYFLVNITFCKIKSDKIQLLLRSAASFKSFTILTCSWSDLKWNWAKIFNFRQWQWFSIFFYWRHFKNLFHKKLSFKKHTSLFLYSVWDERRLWYNLINHKPKTGEFLIMILSVAKSFL